MRKIYQLAWLLIGTSLFAQTQNPEIKTELPTIMAPSPTVAALMKFEEVPVSNYTGVPDISIPLFNLTTRSKDINLNLSLNYHPSSIAAREVASDVGLGWSLFVGGSISRTVRGIPDEYLRYGSSRDNGKVGIYRNGITNYSNPYYEVISTVYNTPESTQRLNEFLWESQEKGKYDTEHDMWQYNFMGYSGRFIIKKNTATNLLEVLDQNLASNLRIVNYYETATYVPTSFTIFDAKGYKYIFDVKEETESINSTYTIHNALTGNSEHLSVSQGTPYISSFQLSKVYDRNNNLILSFIYNDANKLMLEKASDASQIVTNMVNSNVIEVLHGLAVSSDDEMQGQHFKLEPRETISTNTRTTKTKKVNQVIADGIGKISISYESGRLDQADSGNSYRIKSLTLYKTDGASVKNIELYHSYSTVTENRMMLTEVKERGYNNSSISTDAQSYKLFYDDDYETLPIVENSAIGKDPWGYFKLLTKYPYEIPRKASMLRTANILQKMVLPTGGCIIFDFEENQYSHIGDTSLSNFDENLDNWELQDSEKHFTTLNNNITDFFTITDLQTVYFESTVNDISQQDGEELSWIFNLYRRQGSTNVLVTTGGLISKLVCNSSQCTTSLELGPGEYRISLENHTTRNGDQLFQSAVIKAHYKNRSPIVKNFFNGGGNRIKKIGHFTESNVPKNFYRDQEYNSYYYTPKREQNYNYNFFGQSKSSGSLVFGKPIFEYVYNKQHHFIFKDGISTISEFINDFTYKSMTDFNNLQVQRTKGADVGYQNVTVSESNNGKKEFTYLSPIDVPESDEAYSITYPFYPSKNLDYKRGLIKKEKVFDNISRAILETEYGYTIIDEPTSNTQIGIRTFYQGLNCPTAYLFNSYTGNYEYFMQICQPNPNASFNCKYLCGNPFDYIAYRPIYEAFGWAKLSSKNTKSYFYDGTNVKTVESSEAYTYNPMNKQIATSTVTDPLHVTEQRYYYHSGNSPTSQNRISEIERVEGWRDGTLVSSAKISYSNAMTPGQSWMPQSISSAKGTQALESKVRYNAYDNYGNPLEVQQEDGTKTSYIWGYGKTQPIAKLENLAYSSIPPATVTALQLKSDTGTEAELLTGLAGLRSSLPNAMVTTYTYKPLVGITSITDAKGIKTTYEYDSFGRLKSVYDHEGNLLSENEYKYRQN